MKKIIKQVILSLILLIIGAVIGYYINEVEFKIISGINIEIILGMGTLLLFGLQGWILWKQTRIIDSQKEIAKNQSVYLMRKEDPQIEIQTKTYQDDKISLNLFNNGKTKAVGVALKTEAYIIKSEIKNENDRVWISNRGDWDTDKQFNFRDGKEYYSLGSCIVEIFQDKSNYPELEPNQNRKFTQEVLFGLYAKKGKFSASRYVTFKHLTTLLKLNEVLGCEIIISLLYKNLTNEVVEEKLLDKFCISLSNLQSKFLSELKDKDKVNGEMKCVSFNPFFKQKLIAPKSEETYRYLNHCKR